jgi:hypothetical protein
MLIYFNLFLFTVAAVIILFIGLLHTGRCIAPSVHLLHRRRKQVREIDVFFIVSPLIFVLFIFLTALAIIQRRDGLMAILKEEELEDG